MKRVTVDDVMKWKPCGHDRPHDGKNYTRQRIQELWGDKETLTAIEIAALHETHAVPKKDIIWALIRMLNDETQQRAFARECAIAVIHLWNAPEIVKRYLETGDEKIRGAAYAAYAAYAAAAYAAYAATDAAYAAAYAAYAAYAAARDTQIKRLIEMITKEQ